MTYVLKFLVALALAVLALPWPVTVIVRGLSMGIDHAMQVIVAKAKDSKDSGAKAGMLLLSGIMVLSGLWPAALLLAFVTVWHERLILWLFVQGINVEDTRVHNTQGAADGPPPDKTGRVYQLPASSVSKGPNKDTLLTAPQALLASRKCGWEPLDMGYEWASQQQCWYNATECLAINGDRIGWVQNNQIKTA